MGQITGNDKDFPTIKQVNDALSGAVGRTLDISEYLEDLFALTNTKIDVFDTELTNQHLLELIDKILEVKPTVLKGSVDETLLIGDNFSFETSDIVWSTCDTGIYKNQYKITFKIYLIAYSASYYFSFYKVLEYIFYSKFIVEGNDSYIE